MRHDRHLVQRRLTVEQDLQERTGRSRKCIKCRDDVADVQCRHLEDGGQPRRRIVIGAPFRRDRRIPNCTFWSFSGARRWLLDTCAFHYARADAGTRY